MKTAQFIGREAEMARLKDLLSTRSANLIVVGGKSWQENRIYKPCIYDKRMFQMRLYGNQGFQCGTKYFSHRTGWPGSNP